MSIDLDGYERLGDLERPFELNAKDERRQQDQRRLRDFMRCDVALIAELRGRRDVNIESDQLFTCRQGGIHNLALLSGGDRSNSQADIARLSGGWAVDPNALADLAMNNKGGVVRVCGDADRGGRR
jgi:hypothetical protein